MKRFILFMFSTYYPLGGVNDIKDSFDTMKDAEKARDKGYEADKYTANWQILDTKKGNSYHGECEE